MIFDELGGVEVDSFRNSYLQYLHQFTLSKQNNKSYHLARVDAGKKYKKAVISYKHLSDIITTDLLRKEKFNWINERPPLAWYSAANAAVDHQMNFTPELACILARASNYYGDFERAKKMSSFALERLSNNYNRVHFEATKQLAKSLKNDGDFDKSQMVLRKAFYNYNDKQEFGYIAYLYMLFAKLCNDYQQRQGWYQAFHRIAKERIANSLSAPDKWKKICDESFAKSNFVSNPQESIKIYSRLATSSTLKDDSYVRRMAHLHEARILNALKYSKEKKGINLIEYFHNELEKYWNLIAIAEGLGNIKAVCVRKAHMLRLARKVELWRRSILFGTFIALLSYG